MLIKAHGLPLPFLGKQKDGKVTYQYKFHPSRQWKSDFAWPEKKVLLETEGGVYSGGRHVRGKGYEGDCEKYNEALLLGWRVIRVTNKHLKNGEMIKWLSHVLLG